MWEDQVIQGITGGILAIVGILLAISGGDLWGRKLKWSIALGFALTGFGLFILITSFPQYAIGFSVLATLALAFAAFLTIKEANTREERRIEEERRKQEEDRELNFKLRLLDEVRDWAREAVKLGFLYERAKSKSETRSVFEDMIEDVAKTADVADMAAKIFVNELKAPVEKAMSFVKSYKDPSKFASKEYFDSLHELLKAINEAKRKLLSLQK
jgi:prepilin signal peptidase PulO-like enzyme (type II secretory pathway)